MLTAALVLGFVAFAGYAWWKFYDAILGGSVSKAWYAVAAAAVSLGGAAWSWFQP